MSDARKPWLVTGASGLLGHSLVRHLVEAGRPVVGQRRRHPVDVAGADEVATGTDEPGALADLVRRVGPAVVVHTAGLADVDACERRPDLAEAANAALSVEVAEAAKAAGAALVHISTDHLWDGSRPFVDEETPPHPINVYGHTKLAAESAALRHPDALIVRTNFFGPGRPWRRSFSDWLIDSLAAGRQLKVFVDSFFTPIALAHLCPILVTLADRRARGIFHVAGGERVSKHDFALRLARQFGYDERLIAPGSLASAGLLAARPLDMSLSTAKMAQFLGVAAPQLDAGLATLSATPSKHLPHSATGTY